MIKNICAGAILVSTTVALSGCASVNSKVQTINAPVSDGIPYYMPRKPIKVSVTVDAAGKETPSVDTVDAEPDLSRRFLLGFDENFIGKNHLAISVTQAGLLTSSSGDTTSGVATIVQNIAKIAGQITTVVALAQRAPGETEASPCAVAGTYSLLIYPENKLSDTICDYTVTLTPLLGENIPEIKKYPDTNRLSKRGRQAGIFYKQDIPYRVHIQKDKGKGAAEFIAYSPDISPVAFLPVVRTLFSDNKTTITLTQGTVTGIDEQADGEIVALSELPADFITAYTTAVGGLLSSLGTSSSAKAILVNNQQSLSVANLRRQACASAVDANKAALDPSNLNGKKGDDLTAAMNQINTVLASIKTVCTTQ